MAQPHLQDAFFLLHSSPFESTGYLSILWHYWFFEYWNQYPYGSSTTEVSGEIDWRGDCRDEKAGSHSFCSTLRIHALRSLQGSFHIKRLPVWKYPLYSLMKEIYVEIDRSHLVLLINTLCTCMISACYPLTAVSPYGRSYHTLLYFHTSYSMLPSIYVW